MNNAYNLNPPRGATLATLAVALGVLGAPLVGAALYLRLNGECSAGDVAAVYTEPGPHGDLTDWSRTAASTLDGSQFAMSALVGEPVVLYFWATWCPQCKIQRDVLHGLAREWGDRPRVVALSIDDDASAVKRYLNGRATLPYELRASRDLLERFEVEALPTLAVIDAAGRPATVSVGLTDADQLRGVVGPLLR